MLATTFALAALFTLVVGWKKAGAEGRDWKSSYGYAHQSAVKYRRQRDRLQALLTTRVLEVRALRWQLKKQRHLRVHQADSLEAIRLASIAYGVDYGQMVGIARCESHLYRYAKNRNSTASGLFQFLTGTFARTPYGRESIWSPYANAMAAGWLLSRGGRSQWVC